MESIKLKLKLSAEAVGALRVMAEEYVKITVCGYTDLLEHGILAGLLKRKAGAFLYPKEVNTITLKPEEAAVIHQVASYIYRNNCHLYAQKFAYQLMEAIGPKLPTKLISKL